MNNTILEIKDLSIALKNKILFKDVNMTLSKGQFITIVGENGVGKTSLLRCLLGQMSPHTGKYSFFPNELKGLNYSGLNNRVGWVMNGSFGIPTHLTVTKYFNLINSFYKNWNNEKYKYLIDSFKLDGKSKISNLSTGEMSKMKLIQAFSISPEILILDELTENLSDESSKVILEELIKEFTSGNQGVLYISHRKEKARMISDEIFHLTSKGLCHV